MNKRSMIARCPLLFLALLPAFVATAQTDSYNRTLKSGYRIESSTDDSLMYLHLKKGNAVIAEISSHTKGLPLKGLGYVGADFTNYFALVHSFGAGNPHYMELINKADGKNILNHNAEWIDASEELQAVLYTDIDAGNKKFILYDCTNNKKNTFNLPSDITGPINEMEIENITSRQLIIKYYTADGTKRAVFSR
jgi:hypothetical protein